MDVQQAIRDAERILPGVAVDIGLDPRWQAIIAIGEHTESEPAAVWEFIQRWGVHSDDDLRMAIATCLLEHLLDYHFDAFLPRVEELALTSPLFRATFLHCWQMGQSAEPGNAERFLALRDRLRERC